MPSMPTYPWCFTKYDTAISSEGIGPIDHLSDLSLLHSRNAMKDTFCQWLCDNKETK